MKNFLFSLIFLIVASICATSCGGTAYIPPQHHSNNYVDDASTKVDLKNTSYNQFDLRFLGDHSIKYEITIASEEGAQLLKGLSLQEAKQKAVFLACDKYNCDVIFEPHFDCLMQDGRVLRITLRGRPANFNNQ